MARHGIQEVASNKSTKSALITRNVWIGERRTSIKMEPAFWDLLNAVSQREKLSTHEICTMISERTGDFGLTGAIRVFLVTYAWTTGLEPALEAVPNGPLPIGR